MTTLPEYLTEQTEEAIRKRMLDTLPADLDTSEGSYLWDALAPAAAELAQAAVQAQETLRRGFAATTFGAYLNLRCEEHGLARRPAQQSLGQVTFTGTPGVTVPIGTEVGTPANPVTGVASVVFETLSDVTLDGSGMGTVMIRAQTAGPEGNVPSGSISLLISGAAGVTGVTNVSAVSGGLAEESDASLLTRYYAKVRSPGTSGNKADYLNWALEVQGVGGAQVLPLWNGPGTVKVVLIGNDMKPAATDIVTAVQQYIAPVSPGSGKAPIGASVAVVAASQVTIAINAQVTLSGTRTLVQIKNDFTAALTDYLAGLAFSADPMVRFVRIGALLLDTAGVQDYANLQVNGGIANVVVGSGQVAVTGTVTLI